MKIYIDLIILFSDEVYLIDDRLYSSSGHDTGASQEWSWSSAAKFNNNNFHTSQPVPHHYNSAEHNYQSDERVDVVQQSSNYNSGIVN